MNNQISAILYCRVSSLKQEKEGLSLDEQENSGKKYAKEKGFSIDKIWKCQESAKEAGRIHFNEAMRFCRDNEVKDILVESMDRLGRNKADEVQVEDFLKHYEGVIHFFGEKPQRIKNKYSLGDDDAIVDDIRGAVHRQKSRDVSKHIKRCIVSGVDEEKMVISYILNQAPLGYKLKPKKRGDKVRVIQFSEDAEKVKKLLTIFNTKKYSLSKMVDVAKTLGLKSIRNNPLAKESIRRILHRRYYYGEQEYQGEEVYSLTGKIFKIGVAGFKPLISKKIWQQNQQILESQRKNKEAKQTKKEFLLNGLMFCAKCGAAFYGKDSIIKSYWTRGDGEKVVREYTQMKYTHIKSTHFSTDGLDFIPKEFVDTEKMIVKDSIISNEAYLNQEAIFKTKIGKKVEKVRCNVSELHEKDLLEDILEEFGILKWNDKEWQKVKSTLFKDETVEALSLQLKLLREEMTKNENKMDKIYDDIDSGNYPKQFLQRKMNKLNDRNDEIKSELEELEEKRENWDTKVQSQIHILDKMKNWKSVWKKANKKKKIELLRLLTLRILISTKKARKDGKLHIFRNINIIYNEPFTELFELGLIEKESDIVTSFSGGGGSSQCKTIGYVRSAIEDLAFTRRSSRVTIQGRSIRGHSIIYFY